MPPPRALVLLGLLAALGCGSDREVPGEVPATSAAPAEPDDELAAARLELATLREALASEHAEREALEAEVERLRAEVEDTGLGAGEGEAPDADGASDAGAKEGPWFDAEGLLAHGVQPAEVDRMRETFDRSEMALLELEDRARREGWLGSPRYREALRDSRNALRAELGDERFDQLLYASGRRNRVVVEDLLGGSPAQRAGLQPGDEILSYGGEAIFRAGELKWSISQGKLGAPVAIDVLRNGTPLRVWVTYGPLGIHLSEKRRPPR